MADQTVQPGLGMEAFFDADGIAIIGASDDPSKIGGRPVYLLQKYGYKGAIYPINPRGGLVQGLQAYTSMLDLPTAPDLALIVVSTEHVVAAMKDCVKAGVKAVAVLSAGFTEAGPEGAVMQDQLVELAREGNIRLLGPNCLGSFSVADAVIGSFSIVLEDNMPPAGNVSIISQSGNIGSYVVQNVAKRGLGIARFMATGNEADVDVADGIAAYAEDEQTGLIFVIMETCRNGERLTYALEKALQANKPVIVLKIGSTESGQKAAASHTGALAGSDAVIDAILRRYGALRVHSVEEMLDIGHAASMLLPNRLPKGKRVTVVAASGGFGIMMADASTQAGLTLPDLSDSTKANIQTAVPIAGTNNPVDASAQMSSRPDILTKMLSALMEEENTDAVQLFLSLSLYNKRLRGVYMEGLAEVRKAYPDRLLVVTSAGPADAVAEINAMGIPVFPSIDAAAKGLTGLARLGELTKLAEATRYEGVVEKLDPGAFRNEYASKKALAAAGVSVLPEEIVTSADDAARYAAEFGFPVVLKIVSEDIQHKTEAGGVILNLGNEADVRAAYQRILVNASAYKADARIDGVLVTPMAKGGTELIMGISRDAVFGPVVMVGMGGIYAEVLKDTAVQQAPVTEAEALEMIRGLKMFAIMDGARGQAKADVKAAAATLAALSRFACRHVDDVAEIDMNPVLVRPEGEGVVALDALLIPVGTEAKAH